MNLSSCRALSAIPVCYTTGEGQTAKAATGDTDTSRDYEYTDWPEVEAFADDFAAFVEARLGSTAAPPQDRITDHCPVPEPG